MSWCEGVRKVRARSCGQRFRVTCAVVLMTCCSKVFTSFVGPTAGSITRKPLTGATPKVALKAEDDRDWREFRAKLVMAEKAKETSDAGLDWDAALDAGDEAPSEWVYPSPIIEQGSILLTVPGDHFWGGQHYFHKVVILIVSHDERFTRGVILNRPTAFNTSQVVNSVPVNDPWNVWCGGDCEGVRDMSHTTPAFSCLHMKPELANVSREIISGLYETNLETATALNAVSKLGKDEFLLLAGYCGWGAGQLQRELDRGETWAMVAASREVVIGNLQEKQASLTTRLAERGNVRPTVDVVGDGIDSWKALYSLVGPSQSKEVEEGDGQESAEHVDNMLRLWIDRHLLPRETPVYESDKPFPRGSPVTILRASPTAWVLGDPPYLSPRAQREIRDRYYGPVFMHKAVLCLLPQEQNDTEVLILLNGPILTSIEGVPGDVTFGGPLQIAEKSVLQMNLAGVESALLVSGVIVLSDETLQECVRSGALSVVEDVALDKLSEPSSSTEKWLLAGGKLDTVEDAKVALLGDEQRRMWFKRMLNIDA